ncbi:MAG: hypothetical protein WDO69_08615 [Pseudomonadota bacterium]
MKELIYSNFQLTRSTGIPTMVVIDGVTVEMRTRGAATPKPVKKQPKTPRRPAKKASLPKEQPAEASKSAAGRRAEAAPQ